MDPPQIQKEVWSKCYGSGVSPNWVSNLLTNSRSVSLQYDKCSNFPSNFCRALRPEVVWQTGPQLPLSFQMACT